MAAMRAGSTSPWKRSCTYGWWSRPVWPIAWQAAKRTRWSSLVSCCDDKDIDDDDDDNEGGGVMVMTRGGSDGDDEGGE